MSSLEHEINYRSKELFTKMSKAGIFVCGAGALGSNLINNLVRQGIVNISVIDMDRVEEKNIATQTYTIKDIGQMKVAALKAAIYQTTKKSILTIDKELRANNVNKLFKGQELIVDVFDNWESRKIVKHACEAMKLPCVHAGMSDSGFAEIKWNDNYKIPHVETKQNDICDYPLAANLVHLTVSVLAEVIVQFITAGDKISREITLKDIGVHHVH